jgi:hypothetical protein
MSGQHFGQKLPGAQGMRMLSSHLSLPRVSRLRPRSYSGPDPRFAWPIFRTAHRRKPPLQSSSAQSASRRSPSTTLRPTPSRPLTSRLCARDHQLRSAADDRIQFAAGRAAVKPACRFRQARGLRRGSEYGSSRPGPQTPPESFNPAGVLFGSCLPQPDRFLS